MIDSTRRAAAVTAGGHAVIRCSTVFLLPLRSMSSAVAAAAADDADATAVGGRIRRSPGNPSFFVATNLSPIVRLDGLTGQQRLRRDRHGDFADS